MGQKQHFIPETYLKQFVNADKMLFRLWKDVPQLPNKMGTVSHAGVGYAPDFNVIRDPRQLIRFGLQDTNAIETNFGENQERLYASLLSKFLAAHETVLIQLAHDLITTLLSFKQRNPEFRQQLNNKQFLQEAYNRRLNEMVIPNRAEIEAMLKETSSGRTFDEFISSLRKRIEDLVEDPDTPANIHTHSMLSYQSGQDENISDISSALLSSDWTLLESPAEYPFITSDNPGFTSDGDGGIHNLDFSNAVGFFFPITPRFLVKITASDYPIDKNNPAKHISRKPASVDQVQKINMATYLISHKYILSNNETVLRQTWLDVH